MLSEEQLLETAASDGSLDITEWPRVLESLLQRLHDIVYNEFPIPQLSLHEAAPHHPPIDPEVVASTPPPRIPTSDATDATESSLPGPESSLPGPESERPPDSQSSSKENEAPVVNHAAGRPLAAPRGFEVTADSQRTEAVPSPTILADGMQLSVQGTLPPELLSMYQSSTKILQHDFAESPPYTIQRLAELVLRPKRHYRFLPAYLRALDRIVSVSSPLTDFPLPTLRVPANGGFLTNGEVQVNGVSERDGLGSDESLGGALLTPIPWLRSQTGMLASSSGTDSNSQGELHSESTEMVDGPHGPGGIETVSVTVNGIHSTGVPQHQMTSSPIASPTLSEQSDASTGSASSTEAQLREQGAVTQGELLRQEQEAGVVPMSAAGHPMTPRRVLHYTGAVGRESAASAVPSITEAALDEGMGEQPHARGPEEIGDVDMGPQRRPGDGGPALDLEAAVGRGRSKSPMPDIGEAFPAAQSDDEVMGEPGAPGQDPQDVDKDIEQLKRAMDREKEQEAKDADGDVMVADVDGNPVEQKTDGDNQPGAVDSTTI